MHNSENLDRFLLSVSNLDSQEIISFFTGVLAGFKVFESDTTKYRLGCVPRVKNQSNLITIFRETSRKMPYKKL